MQSCKKGLCKSIDQSWLTIPSQLVYLHHKFTFLLFRFKLIRTSLCSLTWLKQVDGISKSLFSIINMHVFKSIHIYQSFLIFFKKTHNSLWENYLEFLGYPNRASICHLGWQFSLNDFLDPDPISWYLATWHFLWGFCSRN